MLSIVLFAFSLSLDALGYSLGFGSRKVRLSLIDFFAINILNVLILSFFFQIYSNELFMFHTFLESFGNYLLMIFGFYYILLAIKEQIVSFKNKKIGVVKLKENYSYLTTIDLLLLLSIFVVENIFATIIFCTNFTGQVYFIAFIFLFHLLFFSIGFFMGNKVASGLKIDSSFLSGTIFVLLSLINF